MKPINQAWIEEILKEDIQDGDKTTQAVIPKETFGSGVLLAKQDLVICGLSVVESIFHHLDSQAKISFEFEDGQRVRKASVMGKVESSMQSLLLGERTALNILQRLSGIATLTNQYSSKISKFSTKILDTRKTLPLYRDFEKYAVRCGGGVNHRLNLADQMMIKDNHIACNHGDVLATTKKAKAAYPNTFLVVEIADLNQIEPAIEGGADRLLLDNMEDGKIQKCLETISRRVPVEVSGNITLDRLVPLAQMGVDFISVGAITHSAPSADISFKITPKVE